MNDAQLWTVIGAMVAAMATLITMTLRIVKVEIGGLGHQLGGRIDGMEHRLDAKIEGVETRLDAKIDGVDNRLGGVEARLNAKIEGLDRDVHTLFQRFTERDT